MFENSVALAQQGVSVSIADTDNGRTVRRYNAGSGAFVELVIARQETNENKGLITDRFLVQRNNLLPDAVTGKPVRASVSLTMSYPRHPNVENSTMVTMIADIVSFLMGTIGSSSLSALSNSTTRIFNGET
jgi:hypothetical protein